MPINLKVPQLKELKPRIMVCGVGGAGGNAVNNMIASSLSGYEAERDEVAEAVHPTCVGHPASFRIQWAKDTRGPNGDGTGCRSLR
jgi:cell division GTPase FtsZ